jgi:hypothetical protein
MSCTDDWLEVSNGSADGGELGLLWPKRPPTSKNDAFREAGVSVTPGLTGSAEMWSFRSACFESVEAPLRDPFSDLSIARAAFEKFQFVSILIPPSPRSGGTLAL